jgi:hypothetical protein
MRVLAMVVPRVLDMAVPLFFIAVVILAIGGVLFILQFLRALPFSRRKRNKRWDVPQALQALASACVFIFGLFLLMLVLFVRTYDVFTREEPIAQIQCVPVDGRDHDMILRFVPLAGGKERTPRLFRLKGDQWAVSGHILQWHPWLNVLGLHTGYRITRIEGQYLEAEDEASRRRTVYDLGDSWTQGIWHWLYRHHGEIPLVRAVYGNTAYTFPEADQTFLVMVTISGFKVAGGRERQLPGVKDSFQGSGIGFQDEQK